MSRVNASLPMHPSRAETPPVSWLGGASLRRGLPAPLPDFFGAKQWPTPCIYSALQSRGGDGISPSSRARSLWWLLTVGSIGLTFQASRSRRMISAQYKQNTAFLLPQFAGGLASGTSFPALRISMCKILTGKSGRLLRGSADMRAIFFTSSTASESHWPKIV